MSGLKNRRAPKRIFDRILVAIADPQVKMGQAVRRASELAHKSGASIELFNAIPSAMSEGSVRAQAEHFTRLEAQQNAQRLERMARQLLREGIVASSRVQTGMPVHEAILKEVRLAKANLVVIQARKHSLFARVMLTQTDFELIRRCPVPLLIVKGRTAWRRPRIMAALDPFHRNNKPAALDAEILDAARDVAAVMHGSVHAAHIYLGATATQQKAHTSEVRRRFYEALKRHGIAKSKAHLVCGDPAVELPNLARSLGAGLVVMGALSRSGLRRVFIGNTAERVLDGVRCDVLVVRARVSSSSASP
jgi:universal stress protein E